MKTYKEFIEEAAKTISLRSRPKNTIKLKLSGDTHSIVDGLNRSKGAILKGRPSIYARFVNQRDLTPLTPEEIRQHDTRAANARKTGDYFTGSTFGNETQRYSVQRAIDKSRPPRRIGTRGFVGQQVKDWWQGNTERAKKANDSKHPIIIMKHG